MRSVYFAVGRAGLIKVGTSRDPMRRARELHVELIRVVPGGFELETQIKQILAPYRAHGEWFMPSRFVRGLIKRAHLIQPIRAFRHWLDLSGLSSAEIATRAGIRRSAVAAALGCHACGKDTVAALVLATGLPASAFFSTSEIGKARLCKAFGLPLPKGSLDAA